MKKIVIGLVLSIAFLLAAVYLFIPPKTKIEASVPLNAALPGVFRTLINDSNWQKWWPAKTPLVYNEQTYSIKGKFFNTFDIDIYSDKDTISSRLELVEVTANTMTVFWKAEQVSSKGPFKRFERYRHARQTEKDMNAILQSLKTFFQNKENIYGLDIKETLVKDSALITTRRSFDHYPGAQEIDSMIRSLKKYISQNSAIAKNSPMLNVFELGNSRYEAMTAVPVNKELPKTNEFAPKFMLKGGNILEVQVQGGPYTIEKGLKELENYRADHKFSSPAIPYQLLVTDRLKEPDTTKWITRLYYPIY
jgi:hypothetical protein